MQTYQTEQLYWTIKPSLMGWPELVAGFSPDRLTPGWSSLLPQVLGTDEFGAALAEYAATYPASNLTTLRKDHELAAVNRNLRNLAETQGTPCYVRFGKLPKAGYSINHRDNVAEPGVSVYRAYKVAGRYVIALAGADAGSGLFIIGKAQMYEVTGDLAGTGSDGEPCLINCRARKVSGETKVEVIF